MEEFGSGLAIGVDNVTRFFIPIILLHELISGSLITIDRRSIVEYGFEY